MSSESKSAGSWLLVVFLAMSLLMTMLWQFVKLEDGEQKLAQLPLVGPYVDGKNLPLNAAEISFFKEARLLKRYYRIGSQMMFVTVIDGTRNRSAVHDPYYCFKGRGWQIHSQQSYPLDRGTASIVHLQKQNGMRGEAMFWFTDGEVQYNSPIRYWIQTTLRRITFGYYSKEPLLVALQPVYTADLQWDQIFEQFPELKNF